MDILHAQLSAIQRKLAFVQVDPIDWKTYVLVFSWGICLFESYLLYVPWSSCVPPFPQTFTVSNSPIFSLRQYPLYSKPAPPAVLADHFKPESFEKSQKYGKHKAKYSIVSGLYRQFIDTLQIASGLYYPWAWSASGQLLGLAGYGPEYLVCAQSSAKWVVDLIILDFPIRYFCLPPGIRFLPSKPAIWSIRNLRP